MDKMLTVRLTQLTFGFRSGVQETTLEEDGVITVSYGVQTLAQASFTVQGGALDQPFSFDLNVPLGPEGSSAAVDRARDAARKFLAALSDAEVSCD